jgi:hypothetical protein
VILQLSPTIPLDTPMGPAQAHFLIENGDHQHLQWVTFHDDTGECWTWENPKVRLAKNVTMGIRTKEWSP